MKGWHYFPKKIYLIKLPLFFTLCESYLFKDLEITDVDWIRIHRYW